MTQTSTLVLSVMNGSLALAGYFMTSIKIGVLVIKCISERKWDNNDDDKEEEEDYCHGIMLIIVKMMKWKQRNVQTRAS